jgi:RNA polymerase sigma factor (sigma-70 family)
LVRRFTSEHDDEAFAALMDRHGPMVLGVARRLVHDHHTAEDVFQATFLRLARRARQLRDPAALPAWLHQTAYNLALTALRARKRRLLRETSVPRRASTSPLDELSSRELLTLLDEELRRLPDTFRLPLILCCLEGRSLDEAATVLGWTVGSVKGRLERGRQRLRDLLAARGLTFAAAAGTTLLVERPALAGPLRQATLQAVRSGASVSPAVTALASGARLPLSISWKALVFAVGIGLLGMGLLSRPDGAEQHAAPPVAAADDRPPAPHVAADGDPLPEGAVARLGSSRLRIGNSDFALAPDGRTIVCVTPEGIVRKFDAQTGRLLERRQLTPRAGVDPAGQWRAQLSADGRAVVLGENRGDGRRLAVWDVESGKMVFRCEPGAGIETGSHGLSADGKQLAVDERTGGPASTQTLRVYDLQTGRRKELGSLEFNVYDVRVTADGKRVFVSQTSSETSAATFACFDVQAGKELWRLPRKGVEFAISPDGRTLVAATFDGRFQVIVTDQDSGKPTESFKTCRQFQAHPNVRAVMSPDNRTLVMSHFDAIILWDLQTETEIRRLSPPKSNGRGYGTELGAMSADGRTLITNLGHLQRWDLTTGKPFFDAPPADNLGGPIENVAFTADGKELFASSWGINSARWDLANGKQLGLTRERFGRQVVSTPDGLRALRYEFYKTQYQIMIVDPLAGKPVTTVRWADPKEVGVNGLRAYALTANGKTLLIAHSDEPGKATTTSVISCDVASGRRLTRFTVPGYYYLPGSPFSPCGRWTVLNGKVYYVGTGTELFTPRGGPDEQLLPVLPGEWRARGLVWFSEDGRLLAGHLSRKPTGATDELAVWELASGKILARLPQAGMADQVAFAPDGRTLALVDGWGIRIEDLLTGKRLAGYAAPDVTCDLLDRGCRTQTLVFAPDGRTLATGHRDSSIVLWKVPQPAYAASAEIAEAERDALWAELGSDSPLRARAAVERLVHRPAAATALLTARFRPVAVTADPAAAALVKDLDRDEFAIREKAMSKLREQGMKAEPALRRALAGTPSLEMRRRVEELLNSLAPPPLRLPASGETLRGIRAIEVLERLRTPEARKLLQAWAEQVSDGHLAVEARGSLERLGAVK